VRRPNPINIRAIDHVVIRAADVAPMLAFYIDVLGCRLERALEEVGLIQLRAGESLIDLVDAASPLGEQGGGPPEHGAPNMDHFCLRLAPWNADAIRAHLEDHGVEVGEVADRYGAGGPGPSIYIRDPEGNTVELKG
jgi:glyoxylase I family protein